MLKGFTVGSSGIRTHNPRIIRLVRYPLGHTTSSGEKRRHAKFQQSTSNRSQDMGLQKLGVLPIFHPAGCEMGFFRFLEAYILKSEKEFPLKTVSIGNWIPGFQILASNLTCLS